MVYSESFKERMVEKILSTPGLTAGKLSGSVDVHQSTLSRWLREAGSVAVMPKKKNRRKANPKKLAARSRRPQDWSPEERLQVVMEVAGASDEELGEILRSRGLHSATVEQWRESMLEGLREAGPRRKQAAAHTKKVHTLEREIRRKDRALAETAALLVLKKKVQEIWAEEEDELMPRSDT